MATLRSTSQFARLAKYAAKLCRAQLRAGGWFSIEYPEANALWEQPCLKSFALVPMVTLRKGDLGAIGAPWARRTGWLTNAEFLPVVEAWPPAGHRQRGSLEGKVLGPDGTWVWRTTLAAAYPEPLCERLADAYGRALPKEPWNAEVREVRFDAPGRAAHAPPPTL